MKPTTNQPIPKGVVVRHDVNEHQVADFYGKLRAQRFARVYGAVDEVINPDVVGLRVSKMGKDAPPAWTDGAIITINADRLPDLYGASNSDMMVWLGINAHELGHVTFTPRTDSRLGARIQATARAYPGLPRTFNMLEDQRQERLMIAQYPPLKPYLMAAANHYFKADDWSAQAAWPLLAGRTWLNVDLRRAARGCFPGTRADANEVARIIGAYQRLGDPAEQDSDEAYDLIWALFNIMHENDVIPPIGCGLGNPAQGVTRGQDAPAIADEDDVPTADSDPDLEDADESEDEGDDEGEGRASQDGDDEDGEDTDSNEDGEDSDSGDPGDGTDEGEGDGQDGDGSEGEDEGAGKGGGADGDSPDGGDAPDGHGGHAGSEGHGADETDETAEELAAAWDEIIQGISDQTQVEVVASHAATSELKRMAAALDGKTQVIDVEKKKGGVAPVTTELAKVARDLTTAFRRYTDAAQPYWERETDTGRLNVRRVMESERPDFDTAYDRFHPGQLDEMSLEVVVLLDRSGSMGKGPGSLNWRAAAAAWAIRRAVHEAEGTCTIVAYDTEASILASGTQKPQRDTYEVMAMGGGTDPTDAIDYAWSKLHNSESRHRMIVALTDGDWSGGKQAMMAARARGVVTIGVLVQEDDAYTRAYGNSASQVADKMQTEYTGKLTDPMDMVTIFEAVAVDLLAKVANGYRP